VLFKNEGNRVGKRRDFNYNLTHPIPAADPNNTLDSMKAIVQTANVEEEAISLKELIPFWFAVASPLVGILLGLLGAWCLTWLSA